MRKSANLTSTEIVRICPIMVIPSANSPMSYSGQTHSRMSLRRMRVHVCSEHTFIHIRTPYAPLRPKNKNNTPKQPATRALQSVN